MSRERYRFAPSPNGHLHLGHALSALLNNRAAAGRDGEFLLRIEDIDQTRCTPQLETDMLEDLAWLGLKLTPPFRRQSEHFAAYEAALARLEDMGLTYRGYLTRGEVKRHVASVEATGQIWPRDPDGALHYPGDEAVLAQEEIYRRRDEGHAYTVRLHMKQAMARLAAPLSWWEGPSEVPEKPVRISDAVWLAGAEIPAEPALWGDVVLARADTPTSYHLSVVLDDAEQDVTDVIRGRDLYWATSLHRLLQNLLGLKAPRYRHHRLVLDENGAKLSKSDLATSLRELRADGATLGRIMQKIDFLT